MEKFKEIKQEILRRAKEAEACTEQYKRAYSAETMQELAKVIKDNFNWVCQNKVIDVELINTYEEEFADVEIYANKSIDSGYVLINSNVDILSGNAIAWMYDNSTVTYMYGNSYISTYNYIECKLNDKAIMRVRSTGKVYTYAEIEKPKN